MESYLEKKKGKGEIKWVRGKRKREFMILIGIKKFFLFWRKMDCCKFYIYKIIYRFICIYILLYGERIYFYMYVCIEKYLIKN